MAGGIKIIPGLILYTMFTNDGHSFKRHADQCRIANTRAVK